MAETVTRCEARPRGGVVVELSGGRFFTVPPEAAAELHVGMVVGAEEVDRLERAHRYRSAREKALKLLAVRQRSRREIEEALRRGFDESTSRGVVQELEEAGLIDDLRFARDYARAKSELKNLGPYRIRRELGQKGVKREFVEKALEECFSGDAEKKAAWRAVEKKLREGLLDVHRVKSISDHLKRKGFDFELVADITHELLKRISYAEPEE